MTIGQKLKIRIPTNGKNRYYEGKLLMWNGVYGTIDCNGKKLNFMSGNVVNRIVYPDDIRAYTVYEPKEDKFHHFKSWRKAEAFAKANGIAWTRKLRTYDRDMALADGFKYDDEGK